MSKWQFIKLSDIFELQMGKTPSRDCKNYWDNGIYNWVSIADIGKTTKYIYETKEKITENAVLESGIKLVPKGTIIMSFKLSLGKTCITGKDIYTNEAIMAFLDKHIYSIDKNYIYHLFSNYNWEQNTNKAVKGITLNKATLSKIKIPLPPLKEQHKIASILDTVSEALKLRKQQLNELDLLVKSKFVEMFDKYFISYKYEKPLNAICSFIDYRGKTPEKSESGIPLITAKNVKNNTFSVEPQEFIPVESYNSVMTRGIPKVNDVLFTTEAPLGSVCRIPNIYNKNFCIGQRIITMQPNVGVINSEYLEYSLLSTEFQNKIWQKSSGSTVKGIRSKLLECLTIPVPPFNVQNKFASFVHHVDKLKSEVQKSIDQLQTLFDSLMQQYFE